MSDIHKAMVAIAKEIAAEGIGKSRKNVQQGYNFRGVDEVMNTFSPILSKNSVYVIPKYHNRQFFERTTMKGGVLFYVLVEGEFTFMHEDGSSIIVGPFFGEAMDSADKATNKAMAVAYKYAMFQTFCVPLEGVTGGDADLQTPEIRPADHAGRPMDGVWEGLDADEQAWLTDVAKEVAQLIDSGDMESAVDKIKSQNFCADEKAAIWTRFNSKQRTALKKASV
jgi:ERF superfamily